MSAEPEERPGRPLPIVISIQSQIAWGHVGNSAAAWPMRACGVEVIEVPTALLSNHPHYPSMRGRLLDPDLVDEILSGLAERGIHQRATAILSGFMGQAGTASVVAAFVRQAKDANPDLLYACDPVIGDADLGFFADAALRRAFAEDLVPLADLILPNAFELEALSGVAIDGPDAVAAARAVLGTPAVVATSVPVEGWPDRLGTVTVSDAGRSIIKMPRLPVRPAGTGDLLAGLTVARLALGVDLDTAVARAVAGVAAALARTSGEPWAEMPIAAAIDAIVTATGRETMPESGTEQMR
ncbi:MAG: pyridoxal kinase [Paracoccus sp. (in: a-proteobacteria)]|uniref:pyridoxal kinase n=1 Tax=Paracoccus sp. TaxID=267 RepID=UPI000C9398C9|nr:pyridoxal kinase [Erythrobacter sp.]MAM39868.1 pyridoxal kinase [Erythrobacter sp.]